MTYAMVYKGARIDMFREELARARAMVRNYEAQLERARRDSFAPAQIASLEGRLDVYASIARAIEQMERC